MNRILGLSSEIQRGYFLLFHFPSYHSTICTHTHTNHLNFWVILNSVFILYREYFAELKYKHLSSGSDIISLSSTRWLIIYNCSKPLTTKSFFIWELYTMLFWWRLSKRLSIKIHIILHQCCLKKGDIISFMGFNTSYFLIQLMG